MWSSAKFDLTVEPALRSPVLTYYLTSSKMFAETGLTKTVDMIISRDKVKFKKGIIWRPVHPHISQTHQSRIQPHLTHTFNGEGTRVDIGWVAGVFRKTPSTQIHKSIQRLCAAI